MPGIVMLVLSVTFPTSSGWPVGNVNSRTNALFPALHCPNSLLSTITASFVFCVCMTRRSAADTAAIPVSTIITVTSTTAVFCRFISYLLLVRLRFLGPAPRRRKLALPEPVEDDRRHDKHHQQGAPHPPHPRRAPWFHHPAP